GLCTLSLHDALPISRPVHVQVRRILRIGHQRVRVRSAAGLNRGDLARLREIGDVEDAHAAEALRAYRRRHTLRAAIDSPARLLRSEEHTSELQSLAY